MGRKPLDHQKERFFKTRLAPTPSGYLHLGNVLSFAATASLARRCGAKILLRIDDLDADRVKPDFVKDIFSTLEFLSIPWDEGPGDPDELQRIYSQNVRLPIYQKALAELRYGGQVFACDCNRSEFLSAEGYPGTCRNKNLPLDAPGVCWRLKTDEEEKISFDDYIAGIVTVSLSSSMDGFVVRKKDGFPSYQLASVVDDTLFNIDLIVRGEDLIDSTTAQLVLARRLGYESFLKSTFFFHQLLTDPRGRKLSKSDKDLSVSAMVKKKMTSGMMFSIIGEAINLNQRLDSWHLIAQYLGDRD